MSAEALMKNHLLIAMPALENPMFHKSLIYVCEHDSQGTVGLMINKPFEFSLDLIFEQLKINPSSEKQKSLPVLLGGPLQSRRGYVIHKPSGQWQSTLAVQDDLSVTTSNDIIHALASDTGPEKVLVTLGYAGWEDDQLAQEVMNNVWLVCPFKTELVYDVPFDQRWYYAGLSIGVDLHQLSTNAGHA